MPVSPNRSRGAAQPRVAARAAIVAAALSVLALLVSLPAWATNEGSVSGNESTTCAVRWTAESVLNTDLQNDDSIYGGLMVDLDGNPVTYSNGGYISEVRPEYGDPGIFEVNHWYDGNIQTGPLTATSPTGVHWRLPISTDHAMTGAQLTFQIPRGANFTVTSGQNISTWGAPYDAYTWNNPTISHSVSSDGLTWTVYLGDLPANSGVVVRFDGTVPAGTVLSEHSVATASLVAAYPPGTDTCAANAPSTSGNNTTLCAVNWVTDATYTVADGTKYVPDVTREEVVQPSFGDPGKFGIDGWTSATTDGNANVYGRYVLATDVAMSDVVWVLHVDPAIVNPTFVVHNPAAPRWRVDDNYPIAATIDGGVWDPVANTMTYHLDLPAWSSVIVNIDGTIEGGYVSGATFTNTSTLTGTYAEGDATCLAASPSPSVSVSPSESPSASPSPSESASASPSASPSESTSASPSASPTESASASPSDSASPSPSVSPSQSASPSESTSASPTASPSESPSASPSESSSVSASPSASATESMSASASPTASNSASPATSPSATPSGSGSVAPTQSVTSSPSASPSDSPTVSLTSSPSASPTDSPSTTPSGSPTSSPSAPPNTPATMAPGTSAVPSPVPPAQPTPPLPPAESSSPAAVPLANTGGPANALLGLGLLATAVGIAFVRRSLPN